MNTEPQQPDLCAELIRRVERDQDARRALGDPPTPEQWSAVTAVDADNSPWLEGLIAEHGWPGFMLVGEYGAYNAWLIAQHAPLDLQQRWLPLLRQAVQTGDADEVNLAYLDDRVRMRERRPQRHGTQWSVRDGEQRLFPLDDPNEVNNRRAALGLPLINEGDLANALPSDAPEINPNTPA